MLRIEKLGAVCLLATALVVSASAADQCKYLSGSKWPSPSSLQPDKLATTDYGNVPTLVNVASYFIRQQTEDSPAGYLALKLKQVNAPRESGLQLIFDCASYNIYINNTRYPQYDALGALDVELTSGAADGASKLVCYNSDMRLMYHNSMHFSCPGRLAYSCYVDVTNDDERPLYNKLIGYVVFETLEFELNASQINMERGKFTREPDLKSCIQGNRMHQQI